MAIHHLSYRFHCPFRERNLKESAILRIGVMFLDKNLTAICSTAVATGQLVSVGRPTIVFINHSLAVITINLITIYYFSPCNIASSLSNAEEPTGCGIKTLIKLKFLENATFHIWLDQVMFDATVKRIADAECSLGG